MKGTSGSIRTGSFISLSAILLLVTIACESDQRDNDAREVTTEGVSVAPGVAVPMSGERDLRAQVAPALIIAQSHQLHADLTSESVPYRSGSVVLPLPTGDVLVGHSSSGRIVQVSAPGAPVRQLGGTGQGPGEFESAERIGLLGDTVWIIDGRLQRVTYWPRFGAGSPATHALVQTATAGLPTSTPIAVSQNGGFIATANVDHRADPSAALRSQALLSRPRDPNGRTDTLAALFRSNLTQRLTPREGNGTLLMVQLFSDASRFDASPNGRLVAIVDQLDTAKHEQKTVRLLSVTGEERYRVRVPFADVPFNPMLASRLIDSQYTATMESLRQRGSASSFDRSAHAARAFVPRRMTPVSELTVADDGTVLLRGNDWAGSTVTYAWMRPNGTLRGYLTLPSGQTIKAVRGDVIWSIRENEDGLLRLIRQTIVGPR